jgi:hypothetical protein
MIAFSTRRTILALAYVLASASALGAQTPRTTFANPIDIDYRFMPSGVSRREAADPLITLFGDDYYLFASKSGGYWYSPDMRDWKLVVPEGYPLEDYAPSVVTIGGRMYYTAHKSKAVFHYRRPQSGKWRKVADDRRIRRPRLLPRRRQPSLPLFWFGTQRWHLGRRARPARQLQGHKRPHDADDRQLSRPWMGAVWRRQPRRDDGRGVSASGRTSKGRG